MASLGVICGPESWKYIKNSLIEIVKKGNDKAKVGKVLAHEIGHNLGKYLLEILL